MFVDYVEVVLKGGDGGPGKVSFGKLKKSGPDGGNGGDGGSLYARGSSDITLLAHFHQDQIVSAEDGRPGDKDKKTGKKGNHLIVDLPVGTTIEDRENGENIEIDTIGKVFLIAEGGQGGVGNYDLRSSVNTTPRNSIPPTPGVRRRVSLNLKFIAHYGLVGLPSAGKSSLLNELTNARAKTAPYKFTTITPNLGVLPNKKVIADIPGLIEGASQGKGLGIKFLKHIEKVELVLHCVSAESDNLARDYGIVRKELSNYCDKIAKKDEIVVITKSDLVDHSRKQEIAEVFKLKGKEVCFASIYDENSIKRLSNLL